MPRVKIDYIVSFSSEDPEHPASNLLAAEVNKKKWLCTKGESSCSVVLQLTQAVQICAVHIGAHHAALVEVLVGRSETPNEEFQVLVPSSVFLSPSDSRRSEGCDRVRTFAAETLAASRHRRWDRLRLVCSQPYNKHCKYGLSFVHVFSPESAPPPGPVAAAPVPARVALGRFSSEEEEQFSPGELFAQYTRRERTIREEDTKRSPTVAPTDTGAQIRQATSQALRNIPDASIKLTKTPIAKANKRQHDRAEEFDNRQRDSLMYTDDDERPHAKIDHIVNRHKDEKNRDEAKTPTPKHKDKTKDGSRKKGDSTPRRDEPSSSKRQKDSRSSSCEREKNKATSSRQDREPSSSKRQHNSRSSSSERDRNKATSSRQDGPAHRKQDNGPSSSEKKRDDETRKRPHSDRKQAGPGGAGGELRAGPVSLEPSSLLRGVTFVLSGYANPERAHIRDRALAMGAEYKRDWDATCTHLICAFPNTPKLKQVRSQGDGGGARAVAVTGAWVLQCCARRRRLPWQWFATEPHARVAPPEDADDDPPPASECDTDDEIERVRQKMKKRRTDRSPRPASPARGSPPSASPARGSSPPASPARGSPPPASPARGEVSAMCTSSSSDVTFVKDERVQGSVCVLDSDSSDSESTECEGEEEEGAREESIASGAALPDLFAGRTFALHSALHAACDVTLLRRYVRAYGGLLLDDEGTEADYVLCAAGGGGVRADWVWRCHEARRLLPVHQFQDG